MSWKSVKQYVSSPSITFRLTFFYTLATSLLLILITLSLYWAMVNVIYKAEHQFLSDEIDILQHLAHQKAPDHKALKQEVLEVPTILDNSVYRYYIRILDENKKLVIETAGANAILQQTNFFNRSAQPDSKQSRWFTQHNRDYLLMKSKTSSSDDPPAWEIQVALDVTYEHDIIRDYQKMLIITVAAGTLIALLLGFIIAKRNMRKLHELTETTKTITSTSLHQRINPHSWPEELSALGMAFNEMLDRIESSFSRLTQFSDDLAHELRTPINNLIGETEIALSSKATIEEYKQVLESNLEEFQRITHMIENLLFLARAENPKMEIKKSLLHVRDEVQKIMDYYQVMADEKKITMSAKGQAELQANPVMFRRMLSNLLSNAINYTEPNGTILFTIKKLADEKIEIRIKDDGLGIAPEHLSKLFNRFYRVDSARSKLSGGIGLGLAIVKSIVDLHHGTISIQSEVGKGTEFTLIFPPK